jgi:DNA (cytosine-5)-methyltransferase 1
MTQYSDHIFLNKGELGYRLNHGSLFSGIGGFDLASEWMGWNNSFHCEWNEFGQRILKYYWPKAISYEDITKTDFTIWRGKIDVLTGGFPCQPYSHAGKRLGKDDDRHLWPEMLRAIREIAPEYVVAENVLGIVSWNDGLVFNEVQADLEAEGYEVQPCVLPAAGVGAPHRRDRVWFVAHAISDGQQLRKSKENRFKTGESEGIEDKRKRVWNDRGRISKQRNVINANIIRRGRLQNQRKETGPQESNELSGGEYRIQDATDTSNFKLQGSKQYRSVKSKGQTERKGRQFSGSVPSKWQDFPTQSPICSGNDELSSRLDGITFPKWRQESIKGFGNAIVPEVALQIFKAIMETRNLLKTN